MANRLVAPTRAQRHNPTQVAHTWERSMNVVLGASTVLLLALLVQTLTTQPNPLPAVMTIAGLVLLCFFYAFVFVMPDDLTSKSTDRTLGIASQLFSYARGGFTEKSMQGACRTILPETFAAAICVTDGKKVMASSGELFSAFPPGHDPVSPATASVVSSGEVVVFVGEHDDPKVTLPDQLHAGIVAPLRVGDSAVGTLELYYRRQGQIDQRQMALASGFAELLSAQLATFELERQSEISARVELKALQSQVDPHFLFNTLGTIVSLVRTDPEKARRLIIDFSDYYRQTLGDSDKTVTVEQEIRQGMRYFTLMQARYGDDRLAISQDVDEALLHKSVPPFILQPILENSVKHGMREVGTLHIRLTAQEIPGGVALSVEDDGVGMDAQTRDHLFDPKRARHDGKGAGLAMNNVLQRIHLFFGNDSHIDVESTPDVGTNVTIVLLGDALDQQREETPNVERTHS